MNPKNYDGKVSLMCPTCGESIFKYDNEVEVEIMGFECISCEQVFSRDELMDENREIFERVFSEIGKEMLEDAAKELRKAFNKGFK
jgi:hypothetical protein